MCSLSGELGDHCECVHYQGNYTGDQCKCVHNHEEYLLSAVNTNFPFFPLISIHTKIQDTLDLKVSQGQH